MIWSSRRAILRSGAWCEIDSLDTRVTLHGDRMEVHCANLTGGAAAKIAAIMESVWTSLESGAGTTARTHSVLLDADAQIRGASYQELLNRLARAPESLPAGTETAIVYYLPGEPDSGYGESSLVLNRSARVEGGLQVVATLVYEAQSLRVTVALSAASSRLSELLGRLGIEWLED